MRVNTSRARRCWVVGGACLSLWVLGSSEPAAQSSYSLDDWLSVSSVSAFVWSADGTALYYTSDAGDSGTREIFRVSRDGGPPAQLSVNPVGVRAEPKDDLALSRDGRYLYFTAARYFQNYDNIFRMPAVGGEATALTFNDAVIETAPAPSPDGRILAYFARTARGTKIHLLDLESPTAWPRLFDPADTTERLPVWSPAGRRLAFVRGGDIWIRGVAGGEARRLIEDAHAGGNGSPVWSPGGDRIAFTTSKSGFAQVGVVDVESGRVTSITRSPHLHSDVAWSPDGTRLAFVQSDDSGLSRHVVVTQADGAGQSRALTRGSGMRSSPRFSPDGDLVAYIESTGTRTADIWIVDPEGGRSRQLTQSMGAIRSESLSEPEAITYPGPDNVPIPTLVYRPKDFDPGRKYPVIVRLHGHPGQWNHSFQLMWQYFLHKGFVMVAPNPRGSRGFGQGFHDLHIGDYGGAEFEDIMKVLAYLREQPYVDMTRKATWGGSGGGYMSLVIATEAPAAFEAQIIRAPVASWKQLAIDRFAASGRAWTPTRTPRRERSEFGGSYAEIPEVYDRRSPINFVEQVQVPQLLFHGLRDSSVLPVQSRMWVDRMREAGKADLVEHVEYPDEDHSLLRYKATTRDRLERMDQFLMKHLRLSGATN